MSASVSMMGTSPRNPAISLAGMLGALVIDLQSGAARQSVLRQHHGPHLETMLPELHRIEATRPALLGAAKILSRFATARVKRTGLVVPNLDLREAATAVYLELRQAVGDEEGEVATTITAMSLCQRMEAHLPRPCEVGAAFQSFSKELRCDLQQTAEDLVQTKRGKPYLGSELDQNPHFLRAVIITWLVKTLHDKKDSSAAGRSKLVCVLNWLTWVSLTYSHDFFQMLLRDPWIKTTGGIGLVRRVIDEVNSTCRTSFYLNTSPMGERHLYNVKRLVADERLVKRISYRVRNVEIRHEIIRASGLPTWLFYSSVGLEEGLCKALVACHARLQQTTSPETKQAVCQTIAAILDLFVGPTPAVEPKSFFERRLKTAGIPLIPLRQLVADLNATLGTDYRVIYQGDIWIECGTVTGFQRERCPQRNRSSRPLPDPRVRETSPSGQPSSAIEAKPIGEHTARPNRTETPAGPKPTRKTRAPKQPKPVAEVRPRAEHTVRPDQTETPSAPQPAQKTRAPRQTKPSDKPPEVVYRYPIGSWVVQPGVGIGQVTAIQGVLLGGQKMVSYVITPKTRGPLTMVIPISSEQLVRLRPLADPAEIADILTLLQATVPPKKTDANLLKAQCIGWWKEGSLRGIAQMVKTLHDTRQRFAYLGHWQTEYRDRGMDFLATELALIQGRDVKEVQYEIDRWLRDGLKVA